MAGVFDVGKILSLDWELGVAVQSSKCEGLNAPFVRVKLSVQDPNQAISVHSFELSLLEFKVFIDSISLFCNLY